MNRMLRDDLWLVTVCLEWIVSDHITNTWKSVKYRHTRQREMNVATRFRILEVLTLQYIRLKHRIDLCFGGVRVLRALLEYRKTTRCSWMKPPHPSARTHAPSVLLRYSGFISLNEPTVTNVYEVGTVIPRGRLVLYHPHVFVVR